MWTLKTKLPDVTNHDGRSTGALLLMKVECIQLPMGTD